MSRTVLLFYLFFIFSLIKPCFGQDSDSIPAKKEWYQTRSFKTLIVPVPLISYGLLSFADRGIYSSLDARRDIQKLGNGFRTNIDDFLVYVPAAGAYGLNMVGEKGKHNFTDRSLIYGISNMINSIIVFSIKDITHTLRPDSSTFNTFPSGHTSSAFVAAEFLHQEFKDKSVWYSVAGYSVATLTGVLRMVNNRHWLSDVLVGAGIGMLSTRVTYLVYPWVQKKLFKNKGNKAFMPVLIPQGVGFSLVFVVK